MSEPIIQSYSRRALIGSGLGLAGAALLPAPAFALGNGERRFIAINVNTRERCDALFARGGRLVANGCAELDHFFRDWRNGQSIAIDRNLLTLLCDVRDTLGAGSRPFELISGYRSPATNAARHAQSAGVAKGSMHIKGKAADIRITGVPLTRLAAVGHARQGGGVGFYPQDGFVHLDTGRVRNWQG